MQAGGVNPFGPGAADRGLADERAMDSVDFPEVAMAPAQIEQYYGGSRLSTNLLRIGDHLYFTEKKLRDCIYGVVFMGCRVEISGSEMKRVAGAERVAIKKIEKRKLEEKRGRQSAENPMSEIACMHYLRECGGHPHVLTYIEVAETERDIYLVLPFCNGGELFDVVDAQRQFGGLSLEVVRTIFRQLVQGVAFLGRANVCHRDMSLENVMIHRPAPGDDVGVGVIIDMGMALGIPTDECGRQHTFKRRPYAGKISYAAPEVVAERDFSGTAIDIWGLGAMLFMMLVGSSLFEVAAESDPRYSFVVRGRLRQLLDKWNLRLDEDAVDLMQRIFRADWRERPTVDEIMAHPFYLGRGAPPPAAPPAGR